MAKSWKELRAGRMLMVSEASEPWLQGVRSSPFLRSIKLTVTREVSPDGRFALSASSDETVRVWHLETGDRIGPMATTSDEPQPWLDNDHPGARLFTKCARCHSLNADGVRRSGPHFEGLFGRVVGRVAGYNYSEALRRVNFQWNAETLTALFEKGPDVLLPGTKMPAQRVTNSEDLENLIAFMHMITSAKQK